MPDSESITPYPEADAVLHALKDGVQAIGIEPVGLYLYGSLATGDFDAHSDLDFVVVTRQVLMPAAVVMLQTLHRTLAKMHTAWARQLDGSYLTKRAMRRYDPAQRHYPHLERGSDMLRIEPHDMDWIMNLWVLREHGLSLFGPPPDSLIDPIAPETLQQAQRDLMLFWWEPMLRDDTPLQTTGYRAYAILTMCRVLYTLSHGVIVSKTAAAEQVRETLPESLAETVTRAIAARKGEADVTLTEAKAIIQHTVAQL